MRSYSHVEPDEYGGRVADERLAEGRARSAHRLEVRGEMEFEVTVAGGEDKPTMEATNRTRSRFIRLPLCLMHRITMGGYIVTTDLGSVKGQSLIYSAASSGPEGWRSSVGRAPVL